MNLPANVLAYGDDIAVLVGIRGALDNNLHYCILPDAMCRIKSMLSVITINMVNLLNDEKRELMTFAPQSYAENERKNDAIGAIDAYIKALGYGENGKDFSIAVASPYHHIIDKIESGSIHAEFFVSIDPRLHKYITGCRLEPTEHMRNVVCNALGRYIDRKQVDDLMNDNASNFIAYLKTTREYEGIRSTCGKKGIAQKFTMDSYLAVQAKRRFPHLTYFEVGGLLPANPGVKVDPESQKDRGRRLLGMKK